MTKLVPSAARSALTALALVVLRSSPARADLVEDVERVARTWRSDKVEVERLPPIFLDHGQSRAVAPRLVSPRDGTCVTVLVLGARAVEFSVRAGGAWSVPSGSHLFAGKPSVPSRETEGETSENRFPSIAGSLLLERCAAQGDIPDLTIEMRSARGALEILVARSRAPLGALEDVLPERLSGPVASGADPGALVEVRPLRERVHRSEQAVRRKGETIAHVEMRSSTKGSGEFDVNLREGCHRVDVLPETAGSGASRPIDVDAEVRDAATQRLLARDRSETLGARLDFCLGESAPVEVTFVGAPSRAAVALVDHAWPIPRQVPSRWGARARAGFASALQKRGGPEPQEAPMFESIGVQGVTKLGVPVEAGACYLAAVTLVRGTPRAVRLSADVGGDFVYDQSSDRSEGAAIAFCPSEDSPARLEVEVRGASPWWALAVWTLMRDAS